MKATGKILDETDKKILNYIEAGKTYKYIAASLHIKMYQVAYRIEQIKKYYKCESLPQVIATFLKDRQEVE